MRLIFWGGTKKKAWWKSPNEVCEILPKEARPDENSNPNTDKEFIYNHCYRILYSKSIKIVLDKIRKRKETINEKAKLLTGAVENSIYLIDSLFGLIDKLFETYMPDYSDSNESIKLKTEIFKTIGSEIEKIFSTDEYIELQNHFTNPMTPEKLKMYLK